MNTRNSNHELEAQALAPGLQPLQNLQGPFDWWRAIVRVLGSIEAVRDGRAMYVLLGAFAGAGLAFATAQASMARGELPWAVGQGAAALFIVFYGSNAAGLLLMDRAMGPMQFIPETWGHFGVDANNDGVVSPDNFDDAALSAAGLLCWYGKDLSTPRGWMKALKAYNNSDQYARMVRDWATAYAGGHGL